MGIGEKLNDLTYFWYYLSIIKAKEWTLFNNDKSLALDYITDITKHEGRWSRKGEAY